MITVSARCLARAWVAVQFAAAESEGHPTLHRAVHIEEYSTGVRLIATDSHWLAWCWVPAWHVLTAAAAERDSASRLLAYLPGEGTDPAPWDHVPVYRRTVLDTDHRVRDLMRFLARATNPKESLDQPVELELVATLDNDTTPTLFPEFDRPAVRFETVTRERLLADATDADWVNWRQIVAGLNNRVPVANPTVQWSPWMLDKIAKVAATVHASGVKMDWRGTSALWTLSTATALHHAPAGVLVTQSIWLMDQLERAGVVGPADGSLPRPVLMTVEELEHAPALTPTTPTTPDPATVPVNELARARARKSKAPVG